MNDSGSVDRTGAVPVLMYHSIAIHSAPKFRRFVVHPDEFAAQMDYLDSAGYHPVTAAEFAASQGLDTLPERPVVLTFDDAFADFHSSVLPVLRKHNFRSTLFVPTAYVGVAMSFLRSVDEGSRMALSWQALREIAGEEMEIAAHSHTHPQMDRLSPALIADEVHRSRCLLEDHLGFEIAGFAYPFGYWNQAARAAVVADKFRYACAVSDLMTPSTLDIFSMPRLTVNAGIGVSGLECLLGTRSTPSKRRVAAAKRYIWRAVRGIPVIGGTPYEGENVPA